MARGDSRRYTARHYQEIAALLAAERAEHGASPALNRIITEFTALLTADATGRGESFDPVLFGQAARGEVKPTTRPARHKGW